MNTKHFFNKNLRLKTNKVLTNHHTFPFNLERCSFLEPAYITNYQKELTYLNRKQRKTKIKSMIELQHTHIL